MSDLDSKPDSLRRLEELTKGLFNSAEPFDVLFETTPILMVLANAEGHFIKVSNSWMLLLGYMNDELTTNPWLSFIHPDDFQKTVDAGEMMKQGVFLKDFTNRYRANDGTYKTICWSAPSFTTSGLSLCIAEHLEESVA